MKHLSGIFQKLTVVVAATAALSSCNRAEYAALPQTSSYHGTQYVAAKPKAEVVAEAPAPVAAPAEATPATPAPVVAAAPAAVAAPAAKATKPAAAPKLNFLQKALVNKVVKKANKLASKAQLKQRSETAKTTAVEGRLRQGLLLLLAGIIIELLAALVDVGILYVLGSIVALVGIIFIVLYLLDEA